MIIKETLDNGLVRTYSNAGVKIHGGYPEADYDVVYDPEDSGREYTETTIPVDSPVTGPTQYSKLKILMHANEAGFAETLIAFIDGDSIVQHIWNASNTIEDNAIFRSYLPAIEQALGKTEEEIMEFLNTKCISGTPDNFYLAKGTCLSTKKTINTRKGGKRKHEKDNH